MNGYNGYRDSYHPHLTDFEKSIKIAGIPKFNINEHFKMSILMCEIKKIYLRWILYKKMWEIDKYQERKMLIESYQKIRKY